MSIKFKAGDKAYCREMSVKVIGETGRSGFLKVEREDGLRFWAYRRSLSDRPQTTDNTLRTLREERAQLAKAVLAVQARYMSPWAAGFEPETIELAQRVNSEKSTYWPPGGTWTDNQRAAAVRQRKRTREEVLNAVRASKTQTEAGKLLGVTRARVKVLCDSWHIDWYKEKDSKCYT